jgi:hypothetical protein
VNFALNYRVVRRNWLGAWTVGENTNRAWLARAGR